MSKTTSKPVGRPRTTIKDLPKDWKQIMEDCGRDGGSMAEARALLDIGDTAWYTLLEDSPEFRQAENQRGRLCALWWERCGRRMAAGADGNATVWIFNMKNRFGWRDKQEIDNTSSDGSMSPQPIKIELAGPSDEEDEQ